MTMAFLKKDACVTWLKTWSVLTSIFAETVIRIRDGVSGEKNMMKEIYARGPITCTIADPEELMEYKGGIYRDTTGAKSLDHSISVVGWGEENGQKYWIARNSWGTFWGEKGWFRIVRGVGSALCEARTIWALRRIASGLCRACPRK